MQNYSNVPVCLEEGLVLREAQAVEASAMVSAIQTEDTQEEGGDAEKKRSEKLLQLMDWERPKLTPEQREKIRSLLMEYEDVFALDPSELGSTDVIQHEVDTGDSLPIKQPPRCMPFVLRGKVKEMVNDMLEPDVIQHSQSS